MPADEAVWVACHSVLMLRKNNNAIGAPTPIPKIIIALRAVKERIQALFSPPPKAYNLPHQFVVLQPKEFVND